MAAEERERALLRRLLAPARARSIAGNGYAVRSHDLAYLLRQALICALGEIWILNFDLAHLGLGRFMLLELGRLSGNARHLLIAWRAGDRHIDTNFLPTALHLPR